VVVRITVNETELYFDVEGSALVPDGTTMRERPALLLLHGGPGADHAYFKPTLSELADTAQLIYLDQRSQGRSGRSPLATCTIEQMADDAAGFCRALGIERPVVLGQSFGGMVALVLVLRHPDIVGGLILVSTTATGDVTDALALLEQHHGAAARAAAERFFAGDLSDSAVAAFSELVHPTYAHPNRREVLADLTRCIYNPDLVARYLRELRPAFDVRSRLGEIRTPTLVVVGDADWVTPPIRSRELVEGIAGAELVVLPEAGHEAFSEQPGLFAMAVRRFLTAFDPTAEQH
jgi:proline iminopeptidase